MKKGFVILLSIFLLFSAYQTYKANIRNRIHVKHTDVVIGYNENRNMIRFYQFIEYIQNQKPAKVRIVHYTKEGDPIFEELNYDGSKITYTHDSRLDEYGAKKETTSVYDGIVVKEKEQNSIFYEEYILIKEGKEKKQLLQIEK